MIPLGSSSQEDVLKIYQGVAGFGGHLEKELAGAGARVERLGAGRICGLESALYLARWERKDGTPREHEPAIFWHQNCWTAPFFAEFASISEAAAILRGIQRNWAAALCGQFRRGALIARKLPPISEKRRVFPWTPPQSPMGAWTLLGERALIASASCSSPFPNGVIEFAEDKINPPSRAYLKLWEALALSGVMPGTGSLCLDAGASPGGWTWALTQLGASIIAIDRAPLDPRLSALPSVSCIKHDAFTLRPADIGRVDWLCCDVVCYPPRLFSWITQWLESGLCKNFICTIKMQGEPDFETTRRFAAVPGSRVAHLWHNKHELTWMLTGE